MHSVPLVDCAGRRRSPATVSGFHKGRSPRNKGLRYPPDPPTVEQIIAVRNAARAVGVRRRFRTTPAPPCPCGRDEPRRSPLLVIQRQLGHADLGITSAYLRGIDNTEVIHTVHERPAPMIPATNGLSSLR